MLFQVLLTVIEFEHEIPVPVSEHEASVGGGVRRRSAAAFSAAALSAATRSQ